MSLHVETLDFNSRDLECNYIAAPGQASENPGVHLFAITERTIHVA